MSINHDRRKLLTLAGGLAVSGALPSIAQAAPAAARVVLGVTPLPPYYDIIELIQPKAAELGLDLVVKKFEDTRQLNTLLANGDLDANFFQHVPYLEQYNKDNNLDLVVAAGVFIGLFGAYSRRFKKVEDLPEGALLVYPNDPSNSGRALDMFAKHRLLRLKDGAGIKATQADIIDNPKKFRFRGVEQPMLVRTLDDADLVAINAPFVVAIGLNPLVDALISEDKSVFVSSLVSRRDNVKSDGIVRLAQAVTSPEVKRLLEDKFQRSVRPVF
ncbi:MAG TPA: MetQ/NlpA family ABC transporter substrate-binding protein [Bordetella sp.]